jgi:hypothetical protein
MEVFRCGIIDKTDMYKAANFFPATPCQLKSNSPFTRDWLCLPHIFLKLDLSTDAVSITKKVVTNFRWIYPEGAIYHGLLLPGSYPHFFGEPFVWD